MAEGQFTEIEMINLVSGLAMEFRLRREDNQEVFEELGKRANQDGLVELDEAATAMLAQFVRKAKTTFVSQEAMEKLKSNTMLSDRKLMSAIASYIYFIAEPLLKNPHVGANKDRVQLANREIFMANFQLGMDEYSEASRKRIEMIRPYVSTNLNRARSRSTLSSV